jgi:alkylhydroperoxidase/carboxymuconolactone decarboxylase family protein YurZ
MLPIKQERAYEAFYDSARHNEILGERETLLVHLAAAMALGCYPCMEHYLGVAKELGLSGSEIGAVQASVMAVAAGQVNAQVREASARSGSASDEDACGC